MSDVVAPGAITHTDARLPVRDDARNSGTCQGGLARQHPDACLDEFTFRFDRWASRKHGLIVHRL